MSNLKKYAKYVLWVVAFYFFTNFLIFVGFNANYKSINVKEKPEQISVERAEATKSEGRIYGIIKNKNNLNGKYIKVSIYNSNNQEVATEYLKIENLKPEEEKKFKALFTANDAKTCELNIVDNK